MKKSFIIILVTVILIYGIIHILNYYNNKENTKKDVKKELKDKMKKTCTPFVGGSFNLIFNTNGGEEIESMSICIACSPDSYKDIPIPVKEGYKFLGWFTDKEFTNPIHFTNTREFKSVPKYDENDCMVGYEDINIYAKWEEDVDKEDGVKPL